MISSAPTPAAPPTPSFIRPVLALLSGLGIAVFIIALATVIAAFIAVLAGATDKTLHANAAYLVATLVIALVGALVGGLATAKLTTGRSPYTVALLALILFMSAIAAVLRGTPNQLGTPEWHPIALAIVEPLGVFIGAYLERRSRSGAVVAA